MKNYISILKDTFLFRHIEESALPSILRCLHETTDRYPRQCEILHMGDSVPRLGLLLSGQALIIQDDFWGNRNLLSRILPGQLFAETFACLKESVSTVSVLAEEDCLVLWLDIHYLLRGMPTDCDYRDQIIQNLVMEMAQKNLLLNAKLTHMGKRTTKEKLLSYLSAEAVKAGSDTFDIPFNRQQLADYLSVERSAMSTELGKLQREGYLCIQKCHVILTRPVEQ